MWVRLGWLSILYNIQLDDHEFETQIKSKLKFINECIMKGKRF